MSERGAVEPLLLPFIGGIVGVAFLTALVGGVLVRHQQAAAAADLAALGAVGSGAGCSAAAEIAARNQARLLACTMGMSDVRVVVSVPTGASAQLIRLGVPADVQASAHASI